MNKEEMKDKIKKLLALSNDNASDAESISAFQKAQELMMKYKIEQSEISEDDVEKKCIQRQTTIKYGTRSSDQYLNDLAEVIAENFCCVNYVKSPKYTQSHYICFMGLEDDVDIAEEVLTTAATAIKRGYDRVYKIAQAEMRLDYLSAKIFNPIKTGYTEGYIKGIREALQSQREQNQEWGLVLVTPKEATDFIDSLQHIENDRIIYTDHSYYNYGYSDGINFELNKKLENKKQLSGGN